jgi:predicted CXXCH cytochrome family protein
MKKSIVAVAAGAVILGLSFQASAGVANTKHNMSSAANAGGGMTGVNGDNRIYSTDNPEICIYCHTPHNAIKNDTIPLWNHTLSAVTTYGVYTSPTLDAEITDLGTSNTAALATTSNLCLSCHDGTVAINAINNPSNSNLTTTMTGGLSVGPLPDGSDGRALGDWSTNLFNKAGDNTLKNDHPVNFDYSDVADADDSIWDQGHAEDGGVKFFAGLMQCPSCHDPHNDTDGEQPFLRASINGSALCLVCHNK